MLLFVRLLSFVEDTDIYFDIQDLLWTSVHNNLVKLREAEENTEENTEENIEENYEENNEENNEENSDGRQGKDS